MSSSPFLNFIRHELRLRGDSLKTEKSYLYWIKYFIRFHKLQHPQNMGAEEVRAFLSFLAVEQHVAINTQKSALKVPKCISSIKLDVFISLYINQSTPFDW